MSCFRPSDSLLCLNATGSGFITTYDGFVLPRHLFYLVRSTSFVPKSAYKAEAAIVVLLKCTLKLYFSLNLYYNDLKNLFDAVSSAFSYGRRDYFTFARVRVFSTSW